MDRPVRALVRIVALFALFAFNYFSRRLERLMDELGYFENPEYR